VNPLKIKFFPAFLGSEGILTSPQPAVKHIPEWYKSLSKFERSNNEITLSPTNNLGTDGAQVSTKMCMPFFDATTAGYLYLLEDDLHVSLDESGKPSLSWGGDVMLVDKRPIIDIVVPDNCHPIHYGWRMNWYYETPPGYSVLITHPMNRYDLPFYVQSGIVESDIWGLPVFIAFFLKRNFQGTIPKGTPIMQIIPFKRDSWESEVINNEKDLDRQELMAENRRSLIYGYYKKTTWRKKFFGASKERNSK
jgi:hypothetical protein